MTRNNNKNKQNKTRKLVLRVAKPVAFRPKNKAKVNARKQNPSIAKRVLTTVGQAAGSYFGMPSIGRSAGAAISRIFGQGDYQVKSNSLTSGGPPAFAALNSGIRIAHREYIADVTSSTGFSNTTYDINPSNRTTFPWLSRLASNFEEYSIKGIIFYFNTSCGSAISSTNNALGTVGMTSVYDPSDPPLSTKRECEDYAGCVAGVPSCNLIHPIECKPRSNVLDRLYIQLSAVSDLDDLKFYSHGTLNVFTQGMQAAGITLGELWVSYDIEFFTPKILPIGAVEMAASRTWGTASAVTNVTLFGNTGFSFLRGNFVATYDAAGFVHLPKGTAPGYYLIAVNWSQAGNVAFSVTPTATDSNISLVNWTQGSTSNNVQTSGGIPNVTLFTLLVYKSDTLDGRFNLAQTGGALPTTPIPFDIWISKVPSSAVLGTSQSGFFNAVAPMASGPNAIELESLIKSLINKAMTANNETQPIIDDVSDEEIFVIRKK
jgi:hypothetical protein